MLCDGFTSSHHVLSRKRHNSVSKLMYELNRETFLQPCLQSLCKATRGDSGNLFQHLNWQSRVHWTGSLSLKFASPFSLICFWLVVCFKDFILCSSCRDFSTLGCWTAPVTRPVFGTIPVLCCPFWVFLLFDTQSWSLYKWVHDVNKRWTSQMRCGVLQEQNWKFSWKIGLHF